MTLFGIMTIKVGRRFHDSRERGACYEIEQREQRDTSCVLSNVLVIHLDGKDVAWRPAFVLQ